MEYKTVQLNQTVFLWLNNRTGPHCRPLVRTSNSTFITKTSPRGTLLCLNQRTLKNEWVQLVGVLGLKSVKSFGTLMSQNNLINLYVLGKMTTTINSAFKIVNLHRRISQPQESWKALVKTDVHWVFERICAISICTGRFKEWMTSRTWQNVPELQPPLSPPQRCKTSKTPKEKDLNVPEVGKQLFSRLDNLICLYWQRKVGANQLSRLNVQNAR